MASISPYYRMHFQPQMLFYYAISIPRLARRCPSGYRLALINFKSISPHWKPDAAGLLFGRFSIISSFNHRFLTRERKSLQLRDEHKIQ